MPKHHEDHNPETKESALAYTQTLNIRTLLTTYITSVDIHKPRKQTHISYENNEHKQMSIKMRNDRHTTSTIHLIAVFHGYLSTTYT